MLSQFMPHGMCFAWQQNVLLLHVISDALIALAYFSIPLTLAVFTAKRPDLPFRLHFAMFATFIIACGVTHLLAIWTIWHPDYWIDGGMKAFTAIVSVLTAVALVGVVPKALALRSPLELELLNHSLEAAGAETQATIENLGDGVVVFDEDLTVLRVNRTAEHLLSVRAAHNDEAVNGEGAEVPRTEWPATTARTTGEPQSALLGFGSEGDRRWVAVRATPLRLGGATLNRIVVSLRDVTELKAQETEQRNYARQLHALHLIATMGTDDLKAQIDGALLVGLEPLGLERAYLGAIDLATNEIVMECSVATPDCESPSIEVGARFPLHETVIGRVIETKEVVTVLDLALDRRTNGVVRYSGMGCYIAVPIFVEGKSYGAVGFIGREPRTAPFTRENIEFVKLAGDLISAALLRALQNERLDALAFFDSLTELPNRVLLYDRLAQTIAASKRRDERFAVLFIDLDGFKEVNDRFGHAAGDAVLKIVATRLKDALRDSDTVARLGGDEFVAIAAGVATMSDAAELGERILQTMRRSIDDGERLHYLTVSIGVSFYPIDGIEMKSLIEQADTALYEAKHSGKNKIHFAMGTVIHSG